jgi:hypothetical protein
MLIRFHFLSGDGKFHFAFASALNSRKWAESKKIPKANCLAKYFPSLACVYMACFVAYLCANFSTHLTSLDGWTTADLVFLWKEGDPVQVVKNLHLPRFTLEKFLTDYCNSKTNTGKLTIDRDLGCNFSSQNLP